MSAAWFDAHGDGRPDLYVTNMWTASGRRVSHGPKFELVAEQGLREEFHRHTKGNSLYCSRGDGTFEETGQAEMGRWSWTGDARDFDCDGTPEIVVAAGMISEPDRSKPDLMSFFLAAGGRVLVGGWQALAAIRGRPERDQPVHPGRLLLERP